MSQILSLENSSYFFALPSYTHSVFSARGRQPAEERKEGRCLLGAGPGWQGSGGRCSAGLQASVATGHDAPRPSDFPKEVQETFFKCKVS